MLPRDQDYDGLQRKTKLNTKTYESVDKMTLTRKKTLVDMAQTSDHKDTPMKRTVESICEELNVSSQKAVLWHLAECELDETSFGLNLKTILQAKLEDVRSYLHYGDELEFEKPTIHRAIRANNLEFLNCLIRTKQNIPQEVSDLDIAIVVAFRVRDRQDSNFTCLHSAIRKNLACLSEMVKLCILVEREPTRLRKSLQKCSPEVAGQQSIETIFLMKDNSGNTPLHLLMRSLSDNIASNRKGNQTDPMAVITIMEEWLGSKQMGELWTAVKHNGLSPYKYLLECLKGKAKTLQMVQDKDRLVREYSEAVRAKIFSSITDITLLKRALYGTQGQEKELCLDMSDFNQSSHDFKKFVTELTSTAHTTNELLFEECLVSVFLPDLNMYKKPNPHDGVADLFNWLQRKGGVRRIRSLNIPDNTTLPMSDELVFDAILSRFEIEKFDWRKLDINLDILVRSPHKDMFTDITLYSTGNYSVLYHWVSNEGIGRLPGLRSVTIEIMASNSINQPTDAQKTHEDWVNQYKVYASDRLETLKKEKELATPGLRFSYEVNTHGKWDFPALQFASRGSDEIDQLELIQKLNTCHFFLSQLKNTEYAERFQKLRGSDTNSNDSSQLIKVAIIDNGTDKFRMRLRNAIERGVSYVKADVESTDRILPWWMVSDPHGTQMASLVVAANPWCRLYIARVGKGRRDILPEDAAQAVHWAIEHSVDVISISWVIKGEFDELKEAIEAATQKKILVFCSTADKGAWSGPVYPADYDGTVRVSATDKYGNFMPASEKGGVIIPVPGEDIPTYGPSYMGEDIKKGTVSGSSVATALAAGIASLSIMMLLIFNDTSKESLKRSELYTNKKMVSLLSMAMKGSLFPAGQEAEQYPERWQMDKIVEGIQASHKA